MGLPGVYGVVYPMVVFRAALTFALMKETAVSVVNLMLGRGWEDPSARLAMESALWLEVEEGPMFELGVESDELLAEQIRGCLPVVLFGETTHYLSTGGDDEGVQCSVCLCNFTKDDEVRQTARCSHVFHKLCLDAWLDHRQTTCPLCRSSLVADELLKARDQTIQIGTELPSDFAVWWSAYQSAGAVNWWQAYYRGNLIYAGH